MPDLETFSEINFPYISTDQVTSIARRTIYFLHRGRNAWHSTWVRHYFPGCMHLELWRARAAAEPLRKPGSVFYIDELPAILIGCSTGQVAIVDINDDHQLIRYPSKFMLDFLSSHRFDTGDRGRYAISVSDLVSSFALINTHGVTYTPENIVAVATENVDLQCEKMPKRELRRYTSYRDQFGDLEWSAKTLSTNDRRVFKVVRSIRRKLRKPASKSSLAVGVARAA